MGKNMPKERKLMLYEAILQLQTLEECYDFFEDICTVNELRSMEQRFEVAKMLREDKVYTEIMQKTSASSATISRVNRSLLYGSGGYRLALDRLKENEQLYIICRILRYAHD